MSRKQKQEEQPDALGFTSSDYIAMQQRVDKYEKCGNELLSGWDISKEQIDLINAPRHPLHNIAVYGFYDVNFFRLQCMARRYMQSWGRAYISIVSAEDLLQQLFCDLLCGDLKLPHDTAKIRNAVYKSFRFCPVGGLEGVAI